MSLRSSYKFRYDYVSIILFLCIMLSGVVAIWICSYVGDSQVDTFPKLLVSTQYGKQIMWVFISILTALLIFHIDSTFFEYSAYLFYFGGLVLLFVVLGLAVSTNGALSWISIGFIKIQPSEFMKLACCLTLARFLSDLKNKKKDRKALFIALVIIFFPAGMIVLQGDAGTALVFGALTMVLYRANLIHGYYLVVSLFSIAAVVVALLYGVMWVYVLIFVPLVIFLLLVQKRKLLLAVLIAIAGAFLALFIVDYTMRSDGATPLHSVWLQTIADPNLQKYLEANQKVFLLRVFIHVIVFILPLAVFAIWQYLQREKTIRRFFSCLVICLFAVYISQLGFSSLAMHQQKRIQVFLGLLDDPQGVGWDARQVKVAIGSGGFWGKGLEGSTQVRNDFVTEKSTDFIFCTVGEVGGFVWSMFLVLLYVGFFFRLIVLAERQRTDFAMYYGYAITCIFFTHFIINLGMQLGFFPIIGIPLPLFSYGGSSLFTFTLMFAIFLRLDNGRLNIMHNRVSRY